MVGATNVIVGNAPVELAGVAGGLQSTAMQGSPQKSERRSAGELAAPPSKGSP